MRPDKQVFVWRHIPSGEFRKVGRKAHYLTQQGAETAWQSAAHWHSNVTDWEIVEFEVKPKTCIIPSACSGCKKLLYADEKLSGMCRECSKAPCEKCGETIDMYLKQYHVCRKLISDKPCPVCGKPQYTGHFRGDCVSIMDEPNEHGRFRGA